MKSDGDSAPRDVEARRAPKERERKKLQMKRVYHLESVLRRSQQECSALREHYQQLKEDFQFNLSILDEQNKELERYDAIIARALTVEHNSCVVQEVRSQTGKNEQKKLVKERRMKYLEEELTRQKQDHLQATETLKTSKVLLQKLQTQLKSKEREMTHIITIKDKRIKELKDEVKWRKSKQKELEKDYDKKCEDLVWALKRRDADLDSQRQANNEQLLRTEEHMVTLQENMDALAVQARCAQEQHQKALQEKDEIIQRYKLQLSASLMREREFEQMRVQKELEWQSRWEDVKAEHYLTNEQLIQDLTQARDQAQANLKEKEEELRNLSVGSRSVRGGKDQATQVDFLDSERTRHLQEQNNTLRAVVSQMTKDMEGFGHLPPQSQAEPRASSPPPAEHQPSSIETSNKPAAHALISTGEPPQSVDLLLRFIPTGGNANNAANVLHTQCPLISVTQKGAPVQKKKKLNPQQPTSSVTSPGAFGDVGPTERKCAPQSSRLKQAVSCITRLSRERQRLIDMCNCLRARVAACQPQESVKPERDPSQGQPGVQHGRLSILEQLQYQLTTQELQYALKQNIHTVTAPLLKEAGQRSPPTDTSISTSQEHKAIKSSKTKENADLLSRTQSQPQPVLASSQLSSAESQQSLKVLWEMLDNGLSLSCCSEGERELSRKEVTESYHTGARTEERVGGATRGQPRRNPSDPPANTAARGRVKIRNYNIKD